MYYFFLVSALVLREAVLGTKTIKLHGNEKVVVAVPNSDIPRQEPIVRVKARDLDKVQVVPYVSNMDTNINNGGYEGGSVPLDQHSSEEASPARWHHKPYPNHSNFKKRNHGSHRGDDYNKTRVFVSEKNPLKGISKAKYVYTAHQDQECNNNHDCEVKPRNPRRQRASQTSMNKYNCREALKREPYCIAMLRRAKLCNAQNNRRRRRASHDQIDQSHFRHDHQYQVYGKRGQRYSDTKSGNCLWRHRTRAYDDPMSNSHAHHYSKSRRAHHHSKGRGRAQQDYVPEKHIRRHTKSRRDYSHSKSKIVHR
ncbi:hypothetical protein E2C01_072243 [Portunus trituberculatus]|uniref:Uncharacterized protein n=1 Tax=Portunus trituberculatus TaxID=210409 RepID=A0A5B7I6L9_PORTR|nr:hypothetical protein [Portunus trituberculatus]